VITIAGMMAKYFAPSLAIEKLVRPARVVSSTISMSLVGSQWRSPMLRGHEARVHRNPDIGVRRSGFARPGL
jgi:hypothetical protein